MRPRRELALLDFLRAYACASVLLWHLAVNIHYQMPIFASAGFAVFTFMGISGFLMYYHFKLREEKEPWESPRTWLAFYIRRWFRIVPLFAVVVLVTVVVPYHRQLNHLSSLSDIASYVAERLTFVYGFIPLKPANRVIADWSLAVEMQFYLVFPFLALLVRRIGWGPFFFGSMMVAAVSSRFAGPTTEPQLLLRYPIPTILPLHIQMFAMGMLLAGVYFEGRRILRSAWFPATLVLYGIVILHHHPRLVIAYFLVWGVMVSPLAPTLNAMILSVNDWMARHPVFHWPAELSYGAYLIHPMVFYAFFDRAAGSSGLRVAAYYIPALLVVGAFSYPLFLLVEKPGMNAGRRLAKWVFAR